MLTPRSLLRAAFFAAVMLSPHAAMAQGDAYAKIFFSTTQIYNDNLFAASSNRQGDFISFFGPTVETGYKSDPLTLIGRYAFNAERYLKHVEFNRTIARQDASVELRYVPTPRFTLGVNASYVQTRWPGEFNLDSQLAVGSARGVRLATAQSVSYELNRQTRLNLDYAFVKDALAGGVALESHNVRIGLDRRADDRNIHRINYRSGFFGFSDRGTEASHLVSVGWVHEATRSTSLEIELGPRLFISQRAIRPELAASLRHRFRKSELNLGYSKTEVTVFGEAGTVPLQRGSFTANYWPTRRLHFAVTPAVISATLATNRLSIYALDLLAVAQTARRLSLVASARIGLQRGSFGGRREVIPTRILAVSMVTTLPWPSSLDGR